MELINITTFRPQIQPGALRTVTTLLVHKTCAMWLPNATLTGLLCTHCTALTSTTKLHFRINAHLALGDSTSCRTILPIILVCAGIQQGRCRQGLRCVRRLGDADTVTVHVRCSEDVHCAPEAGYFYRPGLVYKEARQGRGQEGIHEFQLISQTPRSCFSKINFFNFIL